MTGLKLAWRLAFSRDVRQRWRQVSVLVTASAAALLMLLGVGIVHAARASDDRIAARSPLWASSIEAAPLQVSLRGLTLVEENYQFPVVWLQPSAGHENNPEIVPPGLDRLPAPGEGVLSPGLLARGYAAEDFGLKPSTAGSGEDGTIGLQGLSSTSEGWIYARPPAGRTLGTGGALLPLQGYGPGNAKASLETLPQVPSARAAVMGVAWLLVAPALLLLIGGARALSHVRDQRARVLLQLGISPLRIRLLLATETALLAGAGAIAGLSVWLVWLSRVRKMPLTGAELKPDALAYPWPYAVLLTVAVIGLAATCTAAGRISGHGHRKVRPVRKWHAVPFVIALLMMALSRVVPPFTTSAELLLFGGLLLTMGALPLALPVAVAGMGRVFGRSGRAPVWLAGRRLSLRAATLSRPAAAVGLLVFIAGGAFALYGRMVQPDTQSLADAPLSRFTVNWRDERPGDFDYIAEQLSSMQVIPIISPDEAPPGGDRNAKGADADGLPIAVFADCQQLESAVRPLDLTACSRDGAISQGFLEQFRALTNLTPALAADVRIATSPDQVLLLGAESVTSRQVMQALAPGLPAVNIGKLAPSNASTERLGWLVLGWVAASLILSAALLREVGDRALAALEEDEHLHRLGLSPREIDRTQRWTLLPPVLVAIPAGYAGAVGFALFGFYLGFTTRYVARITAVALAVGVIAAASLALAFYIHRRIVSSEARPPSCGPR